MRVIFAVLAVLLLATPAALAIDHSLIDPGDVYYINRFGKNNSAVMVVRVLDYPMVKVRDVDTGSTSVEEASNLLSETELRKEEGKNKMLGWGAVGLGVLCAAGKCGN